MRIEDQVCSKDQGRKLFKLGVKIQTIYEWWEHSCGNYDLNRSPTPGFIEIPNGTKIYAAPTVAELGILLSGYIVIRYQFDSEWRIYTPDGKELIQFLSSENEALARAEALILLLGNEYLKSEDLKL
jgi:hypothetical protein